MAAMAPWMWFVGFGLMIVAVVAFPNPILILFLLLGGMETWRRWKARRGGEEGNEAYYRVSPRHRFLVGAVYVGLIVLLGAGHGRDVPRPLEPDLTARRAQRRALTARSISRLSSRSLIERRLSPTSLPCASAISTFACEPLK